jgi:hypothetical protein
MKFAEVLAGCVYGTIGYVAGRSDLQRLEQFIAHNLPVLRAFAAVVVATNYGDGSRRELQSAVRRSWRRHFPDCVLLDAPFNRGHSVGTSDLDNLLFDYCKERSIPWLCKAANDVLLSPEVFDIEVTAADFYYFDAVSCAILRDLDDAQFAARFFFPQTNFYVIAVDKTDYLVDKELLDRSWAIVRRIPEYDGRIWEHIDGWSCERLLRLCVIRNRLTRCRLMDDAQLSRMLALVREFRIDDCSLKNVSINGVCHCHDAGRPPIVVS